MSALEALLGREVRFEDPPVAKTLFGDTTRSWGWLILRVWPGMSLFSGKSVALAAFALLLLGVAACGGGPPELVDVELAPLSELPAEVRQADPKVRESYQFAVANQEYLSNFPCYCGCGAMGHESNLDCYVDHVEADGTIVFDNHAFL